MEFVVGFVVEFVVEFVVGFVVEIVDFVVEFVVGFVVEIVVEFDFEEMLVEFVVIILGYLKIQESLNEPFFVMEANCYHLVDLLKLVVDFVQDFELVDLKEVVEDEEGLCGIP